MPLAELLELLSAEFDAVSQRHTFSEGFALPGSGGRFTIASIQPEPLLQDVLSVSEAHLSR